MQKLSTTQGLGPSQVGSCSKEVGSHPGLESASAERPLAEPARHTASATPMSLFLLAPNAPSTPPLSSPGCAPPRTCAHAMKGPHSLHKGPLSVMPRGHCWGAGQLEMGDLAPPRATWVSSALDGEMTSQLFHPRSLGQGRGLWPSARPALPNPWLCRHLSLGDFW